MLQFTMSSIGISVNSMYINRGRYRLLSPEAREWRENATIELETQINPYVEPQIKALKNAQLAVSVCFYSDTWFLKSGQIRVKDVESYSKITCDTLFTVLKTIEPTLDDKLIFSLTLKKMIGDKDKTLVTIEPIY